MHMEDVDINGSVMMLVLKPFLSKSNCLSRSFIYIILTIANLKNVSYLVSIITLINGMVLIIKEQNQQNYREDCLHKINSF
jgi:hypothetical protein